MHILVAEDDHDIAELISHYLKKAGWSAHIATASDEALAYVRNHAVDVVILDVMLPGMAGFDVCQAVRGDLATASLPVIMLTARTEEADRVKGLVDKARANSGGVGLGLAIVKHLTELHGGRATVENRPESGAQFTISLPA